MKKHKGLALLCFVLAGIGFTWATYQFYGWGLSVVAVVLIGFAAWEALWEK